MIEDLRSALSALEQTRKVTQDQTLKEELETLQEGIDNITEELRIETWRRKYLPFLYT